LSCASCFMACSAPHGAVKLTEVWLTHLLLGPAVGRSEHFLSLYGNEIAILTFGNGMVG
jgi:hypothetical protein